MKNVICNNGKTKRFILKKETTNKCKRINFTFYLKKTNLPTSYIFISGDKTPIFDALVLKLQIWTSAGTKKTVILLIFLDTKTTFLQKLFPILPSSFPD